MPLVQTDDAEMPKTPQEPAVGPPSLANEMVTHMAMPDTESQIPESAQQTMMPNEEQQSADQEVDQRPQIESSLPPIEPKRTAKFEVGDLEII